MTRSQVTVDDVAVLSGEELMRKYGRQVQQQLVDMIVAALKRDADDEATAISRRLDEATVFARANNIPPVDIGVALTGCTQVEVTNQSGPAFSAAGDQTMRE